MQQVMEAVFARDKDDDQRLFADLGLLVALRDSDTVKVGTVDSMTLFRYVWRMCTSAPLCVKTSREVAV